MVFCATSGQRCACIHIRRQKAASVRVYLAEPSFEAQMKRQVASSTAKEDGWELYNIPMGPQLFAKKIVDPGQKTSLKATLEKFVNLLTPLDVH